MAISESRFQLPINGETYARDILQRSEDLVQSGIWGGLPIHQLRGWFSNFHTPLEKYFGARLLDSLIYRPDDQTRSMMEHLFQRTLPDLTRQRPTPIGVISDWRERLSNSDEDPGIRVVPVIRTLDPPTKSGPLVCRLLKRHLGLNERWMIWPWQVSKVRASGTRVFLFVDDFLGTGHQFRKFVRATNLMDAVKGACAIYAPLVAHDVGIKRLAKKLPTLLIAAVESLDNGFCLFSETSNHFDDGINTPAAARGFYLEFMASAAPPIWAGWSLATRA